MYPAFVDSVKRVGPPACQRGCFRVFNCCCNLTRVTNTSYSYRTLFRETLMKPPEQRGEEKDCAQVSRRFSVVKSAAPQVGVLTYSGLYEQTADGSRRSRQKRYSRPCVEKVRAV